MNRALSLLVLAGSLVSSAALAQPEGVQLVPVVDGGAPSAISDEDANKTADELIQEAQQLFILRQPIDARSKLLKALERAPKDYRPHMFLGTYYLSEVAHFQLAHRYIQAAEKLFEEKYGNETDQLDPGSDRAKSPFPFREHSRLLYLLGESQLNLDDYAGALKTLDRFEKLYWDDWYPGTRAWVLMKLKRVDDAIRVAQAGILQGAEPTRTFNILGILLSLRNNREMSLNAFSRAIKAELTLGGDGQVATPLNNAGEVYSELFQDRKAEAAWIQALQMPDGCDHILPSLNLTIMYINELRLFQGERVLSDFESCFAQRSLRKDTEHRALLALARGRIALRAGDIDKALTTLTQAAERQQWFGKIGTDPADLKFASTISLSQVLEARAAALRDEVTTSIAMSTRNALESAWLETRAWWLRRRGREIGLDDLLQLEDLSIRNTDAMVEYPTLGDALREFSTPSFQKRMARMIATEDRPLAKYYYELYSATNYISHGDTESGKQALERARAGFRDNDRLARAEVLRQQILAMNRNAGLIFAPSDADTRESIRLRSELYELLPSHIRFTDLALPLRSIDMTGDAQDALDYFRDALEDRRFEVVDDRFKEDARYSLVIDARQKEQGTTVTISIWDRTLNQGVVNVSGSVDDEEASARLANQFIEKAFRHRIDPPAEPLPKLEILEGML